MFSQQDERIREMHPASPLCAIGCGWRNISPSFGCNKMAIKKKEERNMSPSPPTTHNTTMARSSLSVHQKRNQRTICQCPLKRFSSFLLGLFGQGFKFSIFLFHDCLEFGISCTDVMRMTNDDANAIKGNECQERNVQARH